MRSNNTLEPLTPDYFMVWESSRPFEGRKTHRMEFYTLEELKTHGVPENARIFRVGEEVNLACSIVEVV